MSSSLILCKNKEPFLDQIATCDEKWNLYDRDNQLSGWTKKKLQSTSQSQICTRKRSWPLFGGLLLVWSKTAFWILAKPLCLRIRSANWWDALKTTRPAAGTGHQKGPNPSPCQFLTTHCTTNASKAERIGLWCFASSIIFTWPLANDYHFFKDLDNFLQGKRFHNQQEAENAFQEFIKSWSTDFQTNLFLVGKNVLYVMVTILINKHVFDPSLSFTGSSAGKESVCNAGDPASIPESEHTLEKG